MNISSKHVAIFLPSVAGGGAERTMLKLANGMAARGCRIDLVLARAKGPYLAEISPAVRLIDLKASRDLLSLPSLTAYLHKERPDVLFSGLHTNIIAILAKKLTGRPARLIVSERNTFSARVESFSSDLRMQLMPTLIRWLYPTADRVVAVSNGVAKDLIERIGIASEQITIIYNPVITPELKSKGSQTLSHPWFQQGMPSVILSVGRLSAQKDYGTLISAFARVRETDDVRLLILGEGEERLSLEKRVRQLKLEQYVCLPGFVYNPYPYMRAASVFVLSSKYEGLPGVLIEALFHGNRLIATDCPSGPREILCDGEYGQLVPVADVEAMAMAIRKALAGNALPVPEESWKRFELETIVSQYLELFFGTESLSHTNRVRTMA